MTLFRIREVSANVAPGSKLELRPRAPVSHDKPSGLDEINKLKRALKAAQEAQARAEYERDQFEQRIQELEANQALADNMLQCPECGKSFPNVLACWPGYLIPGEKRCVNCYHPDT